MPKAISSSFESVNAEPSGAKAMVKRKLAVGAATDGAASAATPAPAATRWKQIADAVRSDIESGRLVVGDHLPSETVLTEKWKVSRMTAHRAMQELQRHGLVTRQRGRGTLVAHNTPKTTGNVALLFHNPLDLLEIEYIRGINLGLSHQYQLILCDSHADIDQEAHFLRRMQKDADGIICMPSCHPKNTPLLRKMVESNFPIVCVDRVPQDLEIDGVVSDNFGASVQALNELLARGHQHIAHFTEDDMHISAVRERYQAFLHVLSEIGETDPERLVRIFPAGVQKGFETMVQIMHDALFTLRHQSDPPTAVFCLNDYCLTILLAAIEKMNLRVPEDIEVLSFHDALTLMPSVTARLHRIVQEPRKIGQLAAERLKRRIGEADLPHEVTRVQAAIYALQADFPMPSHQHLSNGSSAS